MVIFILLAALLLGVVVFFFLSGLKAHTSFFTSEVEIIPATSTEERITIDASVETEQVPLIGFVHGITYDNSKDYTETINLVNALKPRSWRLSGYNNVYEFVVNAGKFPDTLHTSITVNFQGFFNQKYGFPVGISPCSADVSGCFQTYEELKSAWALLADELMKKAVADNITMDYFDVFAEPNWGWEGVTDRQKLELFKIAHDTARKYKPNVKIIGVDLAGLESNPDSFKKVYTGFFDYVIANKLRVDVVSWHEFRYPEEVLARVDQMRRLISEYPALCDPVCPEIHINEYAGPETHLIPGVNVGFLYYFEKAGVNQVDRACWDDLGGPFRRWSSCWAGINDMLMNDNKTPQTNYWVYKAYADMAHTRLKSESTFSRTVAVASKDDVKKEIRILAGRYTGGSRDGQVTITINNYPYGEGDVNVEVAKIPNYGNVVRALPTPPAPQTISLPAKSGSISIMIKDFQKGEAYSIVIRKE